MFGYIGITVCNRVRHHVIQLLILNIQRDSKVENIVRKKGEELWKV